MKLNIKTLSAAAAMSFGVSGVAFADVCDTPSKLGDMGSFSGEYKIRNKQ